LLVITALHVGGALDEKNRAAINDWNQSRLMKAGLFDPRIGFGYPAWELELHPIFSLGLPADQEMENVEPAQDFFVTRVKNPSKDQLDQFPTIQTATPIAGEPAMVLGAPLIDMDNLWQSIGTIVDPTQAAKIQAASKDKIPFNPAVEFLVKASAFPGMSGGGVFDRTGNLLGIIVRAMGSAGNEDYIRIFRADYVAKMVLENMQSQIPKSLSRRLTPKKLDCEASLEKREVGR
jgi:hypothetical protein